MLKYLLVTVILSLALCSSGCKELWATRVATRILQPVAALDEFEGDPITLSTVKSVAIIPVENATGSANFDSVAFSTKMANQLASRGVVRVVFPKQVLVAADDLNMKIERHNRELTKLKLLGKNPARERSEKLLKGIPLTADRDIHLDKLNPVKNLPDAIKLGRILQVDAVLMGKVTDFDPYYRPRLSVTVQAVATGHSAQAAESLMRLTQWGIPNSNRNQHGVAWYRQQVFDTQDGGTARDLYLFARNHHTENRPFDTEIYMRSMDRFYEFVGGTLAGKFLDARDFSAKAAMDKALAEAKKRKLDRKKMMSKVRSLVYPDRKLPSERTVAEKNIMDRRERSWRPDIHGKAFPEDVHNTPPELPDGAYFRKK